MPNKYNPRTKAQQLAQLVCSGAPVSSSQILALAKNVDSGLIMEQWVRDIPPGPVSQQNHDNLATLLSLYKNPPSTQDLFDLFVEQEKWEAMLSLVQNSTSKRTVIDFARKLSALHPADAPEPVRNVMSYLALRISENTVKVLDKSFNEKTALTPLGVAIFSTTWGFGSMSDDMGLLYGLIQGVGPEIFDNAEFSNSLSAVGSKLSLALPHLSTKTPHGSEVSETLGWIDAARRRGKLTAISQLSTPTPSRGSVPKF